MAIISEYPAQIVKALKRKKLGIYEIAERTKISPPTVRKILLGQPSNSSVFREAAEKRIAKLLGIPYSQFGKKEA